MIKGVTKGFEYKVRKEFSAFARKMEKEEEKNPKKK